MAKASVNFLWAKAKSWFVNAERAVLMSSSYDTRFTEGEASDGVEGGEIFEVNVALIGVSLGAVLLLVVDGTVSTDGE